MTGARDIGLTEPTLLAEPGSLTTPTDAPLPGLPVVVTTGPTDLAGHTPVVRLARDGRLDGASDPRADGGTVRHTPGTGPTGADHRTGPSSDTPASTRHDRPDMRPESPVTPGHDRSDASADHPAAPHHDRAGAGPDHPVTPHPTHIDTSPKPPAPTGHARTDAPAAAITTRTPPEGQRP